MKKIKFLVWVLAFALIFISFPFEELIAKGGGSFGGTRGYSRSFGGSKSFGGSRSFGGTRSYVPPTTSPRYSTPMRSYNNPTTRSFGGTATSMFNRSQLQSKYGVPRKVITSKDIPNLPRNVQVYHFGDFASGLMMGYLMGHTSWLWYLPFHPAFYYTQPVKVVNEDGTVTYYPPTFDTSKFLLSLIFFGSIAFIIIRIIKVKRKQGLLPRNSTMDLSRSSFS
ncbi:MAG: hypothetical protein CH6_1663 [Candidatus Kapaibacterium sp.]|nr:MAG: hypothetical protein CH6_1663 [Candidatus Kapabacteria bacterium]